MISKMLLGFILFRSRWRSIWAAAFVAAACGSTVAQRPAPTPADDVVKISTNVIQVDAVITDSKGRVIADIRPDELEVYENGKRQDITGFSFVSARRTVTKPAAGVDVPPPNALRREQIRRTFALVVDDLSLSFRSAYDTRRALKKFVDDQMQQGDLVAIIRTGAGIGALQQFTSDKRLLYAAIERVKWNPLGTGGISAFAPISSAAPAGIEDDAETATDEPAIGDSGESLDRFRGAVFATGTLGALRYIVSGMAELPGRKSVVLFSDGFKMFDDENGASSPVLDFLTQLIDAATRASVVFYTIDARGLVTTNITAEDNTGDLGTEALANVSSGRSKLLFDTQDSLVHLARETGGFAILNNNDLSSGVRRVLEDQSYYLIAYEPDEATFDPAKRQFNRIEIRVLRPGARVRTRSGFFNSETRERKSGVTSPSSVTSLESAITSPFGNSGITLRMNAIFGDDAKLGSFVRSLLHIDGSSLRFTEEKDGTHKASIEILAMCFGDNGAVVDTLVRGYTISLKPAAYKRAITEGLIYTFVFPVKNAGAYQYRVAIRDAAAGLVGSASQFIEVPDLKKNVFAMSGIVIRSFTAAEWRAENRQTDASEAGFAFNDTVVRRIRRNTVLNYGAEVYNARSDGGRKPELSTKIRVFRDGVVVLDGAEKKVETAAGSDLKRIRVSGAFAIGKTMPLGDHLIQLIVTERTPGKKPRVVSQFIDLEVIE